MNKTYKIFLMTSGLIVGSTSLIPAYADTCSQETITSNISQFPASGMSVEDFQNSADGHINDLNNSISQYQGCLSKAITGAQPQPPSQVAPKKAQPSQGSTSSDLTTPGNFLNSAQPKTKKEPSTIIKWFN